MHGLGSFELGIVWWCLSMVLSYALKFLLTVLLWLMFKNTNCQVWFYILSSCNIDLFYNSDTTKKVLIAAAFIPLKCGRLSKYASDLPTVCPRILLSGPAGMLANWFGRYCGLRRLTSVNLASSFWFLSLIFEIWIIGSEIYQETLAKALAKHFDARLLVVDGLLLPGVSSFFSFFFFPLSVF